MSDFIYLGAMYSSSIVNRLDEFVKVGGEEHSKMKVLTDKMKGITYKGDIDKLPVFDPASLLPGKIVHRFFMLHTQSEMFLICSYNFIVYCFIITIFLALVNVM